MLQRRSDVLKKKNGQEGLEYWKMLTGFLRLQG